jgi:hypothetical protein
MTRPLSFLWGGHILDDTVWLVSDDGAHLWLPSELMLYKLDLRLAPEWYKQRPSEWPKYAVKHQEVVGLALQSYTQKHKSHLWTPPRNY